MADQGISELGISQTQFSELSGEQPPIPVMEDLFAIPPHIRALYDGLKVTPYFPFLMENDDSVDSNRPIVFGERGAHGHILKQEGSLFGLSSCYTQEDLNALCFEGRTPISTSSKLFPLRRKIVAGQVYLDPTAWEVSAVSFGKPPDSGVELQMWIKRLTRVVPIPKTKRLSVSYYDPRNSREPSKVYNCALGQDVIYLQPVKVARDKVPQDILDNTFTPLPSRKEASE